LPGEGFSQLRWYIARILAPCYARPLLNFTGGSLRYV